MIDKKTEECIRLLKSFLELWVKFHSVYSDIISKEVISGEDDNKFAENKNIIKSRYEELKKALDFKYMPHGRITDPVNDVLVVETIRYISEKNLKKLENDWKDSYVFLNNVLERLKEKRRRLDVFSPVGVFFKRIREKIKLGE